jgi:hypothetical protein
MPELELKANQCDTAEKIQQAIDSLGAAGGRIVLPEMQLELDRGLEMRSGVVLRGQGPGTLLRKGPGRAYRLATYHNYGMCDVPLESTEGLTAGMTVSIQDDSKGGFYGTFARITWVEDKWVGLDRGLAADYAIDANPQLTMTYPMIFGLNVENVKVSDLTLDGNLEQNPHKMNECRGASIYFGGSHHFEVTGINERNYNGEGFGAQMCTNWRVRDCSFNENTGNGLHPGAGSTGVLFENCASEKNGLSGLFFCVRANHTTVRDCVFRGNKENGISVNTRDSYNLIEYCTIEDNLDCGLCFQGPFNTVHPGAQPHCCLVKSCHIRNNGVEEGPAQVAVERWVHDIILERNSIASGAKQTAGISVDRTASGIYMEDNKFENCHPDIVAVKKSVTDSRPQFNCGHETVKTRDMRHLFPGQ